MSVVSPMLSLYTKAMFPKGDPSPRDSSKAITKVNIVLQTTAIPRSALVGNETYQLETNSSGIYIEAYDHYALSRAMATLM